eukprot:4378041-Pleurochrysis_carterae.AAC.3
MTRQAGCVVGVRRFRRLAEGARRCAEVVRRLCCSVDEARRCVGTMRRLERSAEGARGCPEAVRRL